MEVIKYFICLLGATHPVSSQHQPHLKNPLAWLRMRSGQSNLIKFITHTPAKAKPSAESASTLQRACFSHSSAIWKLGLLLLVCLEVWSERDWYPSSKRRGSCADGLVEDLRWWVCGSWVSLGVGRRWSKSCRRILGRLGVCWVEEGGCRTLVWRGLAVRGIVSLKQRILLPWVDYEEKVIDMSRWQV